MRGLNYVDLTEADDLALLWTRLVSALGGPSESSVPPASMEEIPATVVRALPPPQVPAPAYNTAAVRDLLMAAFSDEELTTFCFDYYRPVQEQFSTGMSRPDKVQRLVEHCERHGEMKQLLARVEQANPYQYNRFKDRLRNAHISAAVAPNPARSSDSLPPNPFGDTLAIRDAERFIGREAELRRLQTMLAGGSVALQGEAKIGKSSLLWRLKTTWQGTVIGPLDCQELENRHDFYACLAEVLDIGETGWQAIRKALKAQTSLLLLDELDVGPSIGLTYEDLARFRGVCNSHAGLKIVTVSRKPLREVFPDPGRGSEAYNFLVPRTLGSMPDAESRRLLAHPWAPNAPQFDPATLDELLNLAGGHPFKLHRAAFHRYEVLSDATYDWLAAYRQDLENLL